MKFGIDDYNNLFVYIFEIPKTEIENVKMGVILHSFPLIILLFNL